MATIEELKALLAEAMSKESEADLLAGLEAITKKRSEIIKAKVEAEKKEEEALSGARQELATWIHERITATLKNLPAKMAEVKVQGFTFKLDGYPEPGVTYKSVSLDTGKKTATTRKATSSGAAKGKSVEMYGKTLQQIVDEFATDEEKAAIAAEQGNNSKQWQLKNKVKERALKENLLTVKAG